MKLIATLFINSLALFASTICEREIKDSAVQALRADYPNSFVSAIQVKEAGSIGIASLYRTTIFTDTSAIEYSVEILPSGEENCKAINTYEAARLKVAYVNNVTCGEFDGYAVGDRCILEASSLFGLTSYAVLLDYDQNDHQRLKSLRGKQVALRTSEMNKTFAVEALNVLKRKFPGAVYYQTKLLETALTVSN